MVSEKGGYEMDAKNLAVLRNEIFSRVRSILYERYGEFVPASLIEDESQSENAVKTIRRVESFKADEDLLDLFEALQKVFSGNYGYCLFCRKEIEFSKLNRNPLAKFCDDCERILSPSFSSGGTEVGKQ
jgi:RNA polymerase-binding transcription factor DksA